MPPPLEFWALEESTESSSATSSPAAMDKTDLKDLETMALRGQVAESDEDDESWQPPKHKSSLSSRIRASSSRAEVLPQSSIHDALFDENGDFVGAWCADSDTPDPTSSVSVQVPASTLVVPQSRYQDFRPTAPESTESRAVKSLVHGMIPDTTGSFELELDQFVVYTMSSSDTVKQYSDQMYAYEMKPLQQLSVQNLQPSVLYVDGYLSNGHSKYYVRKMPFQTVPIGNYGLESHTVGDQVWIQTCLYDKGHSTAYFKLGDPSQEYARYHVGFLWIVDLAKHVVDYLGYMETQTIQVEFHHFRSHFCEWLRKVHGEDQAFQHWFRQYGRDDFRIAVHANRRFIYKEAHGIMDNQGVRFHTLWDEILHYSAYHVSGSTRQDSQAGLFPSTVVTPYVYDCFSDLPFASVMEKVEPSAATEALRQELIRQQHLEMPSKLHTQIAPLETVGLKSKVRVGSVISTLRDPGDEHWRRHNVDGSHDSDRWFALVQKVIKNNLGRHSFEVTWIYRPADTICGDMKYPWTNELFLSDHCSCGERGMSKVTEEEVIGVHRVHWGGSSVSDAEFFCRQTYLHQERRWITWQEDHLLCAHRKPEKPLPYVPGDTVLVHIDMGTETLEPCVLLACEPTKSRLLVLPRRRKVEQESKCPPNELVWFDFARPIVLGNSRIHGRCLVRHFRVNEELSAPYDRSGVGNAFFIRTRVADLGSSSKCVPFTDEHPFPASIRQGMDPKDDRFRRLKGFDLFCGGGNFGRGLEDAGAIEMRWANDFDPRAVHTYMANLDEEQKARVHPFVGSIDDLQRRALEGDFSANVPPVGEVEFVSGGSPCPGFSRLTVDKTTLKQRKNQSMVAAFASFIDIYRPKYGLLENVVEIIQGRNSRSEDVFCQLICAIVGLGYQAHFFLLDAWVYGSPQSRSRVFLAFAAPGYRLPEKPVQSHEWLKEDRRTKNLGWLPNGEPMIERLFLPAAFQPVTAATALADLPDIGDGKPDACIRFPDHRQCYGVTKTVRNQFALIPTRPFNMGFAKAFYETGVITQADRAAFPATGLRVDRISKGWTRVHPRKIMSTVTTSPHPCDAFVGKCLHWDQPRILTVMEVRRAQGFRDHEVILGEPREQWATVGNSVAREVSLALGLSFREALLGSLFKGDEMLRAKANLDEKMFVRATSGSATPTRSETRRESPATKPLSSDMTLRDALLRSAVSEADGVSSEVSETLRSSEPELAEDWTGRYAPVGDYLPEYASSSSVGSEDPTSILSSRHSMTAQATTVSSLSAQEIIWQNEKSNLSTTIQKLAYHVTGATSIPDEAVRWKRRRMDDV